MGEARLRKDVYEFLEAKNKAGLRFEYFTVALIILNVACFVLSSDEEIHGKLEQIFWTVEVITTCIFTLEYCVRLYAIVEHRSIDGDTPYRGNYGRLKWAVTDPFSWVDLASILPFYIDLAVPEDLPASQFIRLLRLFRMMKVEGRYLRAFTTFDGIFRKNRQLLLTSGFVGFSCWLITSSLYYLAEKDNERMLWQYPECLDVGNCKNRYESIGSASYFTLLNLFGEFPLVFEHSTWGRVIATWTSIVSCAVFAIPTGIFGSAFKQSIAARKKERRAGSVGAASDDEGARRTDLDLSFSHDPYTKSPIYNFFYAGSWTGVMYRNVMFFMVALNVSFYVMGTVASLQESSTARLIINSCKDTSQVVFVIDWLGRIFVANEDRGPFAYIRSAAGVVDLMSFLPFFSGVAYYMGLIPFSGVGGTIRMLSLVCLFKLERYVYAFRSFRSIIADNIDVLSVTGFTAFVTWVLASTLMYYAERDNPDPEVQQYYRSIPDAMWLTLLNLSGESPVCDYTVWGKVITAVVGVTAVGWFGIPVGLLGAAFEEFVSELNQAEEEDDASSGSPYDYMALPLGSINTSRERVRHSVHRRRVHAILEGKTRLGAGVQAFISACIILSVGHAIASTVPSVCTPVEGSFSADCPVWMDMFELVVVVIFTFEYALRLWSIPEAPEYSRSSSAGARLCYVFSFYSLVDLLSILPFYAAQMMPTVDEVDDYFRILRLFRLLKMDKYLPSISLIDDVFHKQKRGLLISFFVAGIFWLLFGSLLHLTEYKSPDEAMAARFKDVPNSLPFDLIHLSGDYPLIDYTLGGRFVNFLQILVAVGVVGVPSALIASGFPAVLEEQRQAKAQKRRKAAVTLQKHVRGLLARRHFTMIVRAAMNEHDRVKLEAKEKLEKRSGAASTILEGLRQLLWDLLQSAPAQRLSQLMIMLNVVAVVLETEPAIGWEDHFYQFENVSIIFFTLEYLVRLFTAPFSTRVGCSYFGYLTSFFGCVDLLSIAPCYVEIIIATNGVQFDSAVYPHARRVRSGVHNLLVLPR